MQEMNSEILKISDFSTGQERGKEAVKMVSGDVIEIAPDTEHWHGVAPESWFSHFTIACNPQNNENTWLEAVSEEDYQKAVK